MSIFDRPKYSRATQWRDYSLDYKLFFIWEASLFAVIVLAQSGVFDALSDSVYYGSGLLYLLVLAFVAAMHRAKNNWRWRGVSTRAVAGAVLGSILMAAFLVVFVHGLVPVKHSTAPMIGFAVSLNARVADTGEQVSQDGHTRGPGSPAVAVLRAKCTRDLFRPKTLR